MRDIFLEGLVQRLLLVLGAAFIMGTACGCTSGDGRNAVATSSGAPAVTFRPVGSPSAKTCKPSGIFATQMAILTVNGVAVLLVPKGQNGADLRITVGCVGDQDTVWAFHHSVRQGGDPQFYMAPNNNGELGPIHTGSGMFPWRDVPIGHPGDKNEPYDIYMVVAPPATTCAGELTAIQPDTSGRRALPVLPWDCKLAGKIHVSVKEY